MTTSKPSELVNKWQSKIDKNFPDGLLMAWKDSEQSESAPVYRIRKVTVVGSEGFDPIVELRVFDVPKIFVGRLTSYETIQPKPFMAEVKFDDIEQPMIWSANVSPELAAMMKEGAAAI